MYKKYTSVESRNTFYYEGISFLLESGGREGSRVLNSNHAEAEAKLTGKPDREGRAQCGSKPLQCYLYSSEIST